MAANDTTCQQRLIDGGFVPPCPVEGCQELRSDDPFWHHACANAPIYAPVQGVGCFNELTSEWKFAPPEKILETCAQLHAMDPAWQPRSCYCCCSAFFGVAIDVPGGRTRAAALAPGATVLAGSLVGPHRALAWRPAQLAVSVGVDHGWATMIEVVFGRGDELHGLVVPPDQVLLLADRTLTTAAQLVPGDRLIDAAGHPVPVRIVSHGEQHGGAHHLATSASCDGRVEDHLLVAGGVVVGDYALQLGFASVPAALKVADHATRPAVGSAAYRSQHARLARYNHMERYATRHADLAHPSGAFIPTTHGGRAIPDRARRFVTPAQAADIAGTSPLADPRDPVPRAVFAQLVQELHALYPHVDLHADWATEDVNTFAYRGWGRNHLVVGGGLVRRRGLSAPGLSMVMAQGLAHFYAGKPYDDDHYSCTGEADLFGFGVVSRELWPGDDWLTKCTRALGEIEAMFELVKPEHAGGDPLDPCRYPSLACRITAMKSGIAGGNLPACADPTVTLT